jgi:hypothetical protein
MVSFGSSRAAGPHVALALSRGGRARHIGRSPELDPHSDVRGRLGASLRWSSAATLRLPARAPVRSKIARSRLVGTA